MVSPLLLRLSSLLVFFDKGSEHISKAEVGWVLSYRGRLWRKLDCRDVEEDLQWMEDFERDQEEVRPF